MPYKTPGPVATKPGSTVRENMLHHERYGPQEIAHRKTSIIKNCKKRKLPTKQFIMTFHAKASHYDS